ncbi:terminase family protein [Crocosphaera sp.]|uniref:terminase large subunit domain-containing protein n=1 Tax=Crocosphaera sp. TaxID=2729996 RepID=UPI00261D78FD|nr:terminase family protein [Crocosphaera sp.]MDJ0579056.1 terminase family protein [Crocosphaera sp.]
MNNSAIPKPQEGMQQSLYDCGADIVLAGSGVGTGKTLGLLLKHTRHIDNPFYTGVIFRRTYAMVTNPGSLLDESYKVYPLFGGVFNQMKMRWKFPSGATIDFRHLQHEKTKFEHMGSQIAGLTFDELTHFTASQFWFLTSRNRSTSGVKPFISATCNPDAESWVAEFVQWYLDENGYPDQTKSGIVRYFIRKEEEFIWSDTYDELLERYLTPKIKEEDGIFRFKLPDETVIEGHSQQSIFDQVVGEGFTRGLPIKSFTFLPGSIYENKKLLDINPEYLTNLENLHPVRREQLLKGNWKIVFEAGTVFNRTWFGFVDEIAEVSLEYAAIVRFWDFAATEKEQAKSGTSYTASVKMAKFSEDYYVILDVTWDQIRGGEIEGLIGHTAKSDSNHTLVRWELEGGSSGKTIAYQYQENLQNENPNLNVKPVKPLGNKLARALPLATAAQSGKVVLLEGSWNTQFLNAVQQFDGTHKPLVNDIVDAADGAFSQLENTPVYGQQENMFTTIKSHYR